MGFRLAVITGSLMVLVGNPANVRGEDWPTYQHDFSRSGITQEQLKLPLKQAWKYEPQVILQSAWPEPALHDFHWHQEFYMKPRVIYDRASHVAAVGDMVFLGSPTDDKVYCLDAKTGQQRWSFFTEGPVRLAPAIANGKVYFGSDDGWVYCLKAETGKLVWKYGMQDDSQQIAGNGRIISLFPIRSSVLVNKGKVLFCVGMFPTYGVYLVSLDAISGKEESRKQLNVSAQGYLMLKDSKLYTPTGRTKPVVVLDLPGPGGKSIVMKAPKDFEYSVICAGDVLFAGGDGKVGAFAGVDGKKLWQADVNGRVYGLAVANGRLLVSTDTGQIYCFSAPAQARGRKVGPDKNRQAYPKDSLTTVYEKAARQIVAQTGIVKGYCLDVGCGQGRLASELAKLTELKIVGLEEDAEKVALARNALDAAGLYGRVSVHQGSLENPGYSKYLFNLIISDRVLTGGDLPSKASALDRVLRPCGGVIYLGRPNEVKPKLDRRNLSNWAQELRKHQWKIEQQNGTWLNVKKGKLDGAGQWTHQYADAGNTSNSRDNRITTKMRLQWFGRPGPREMIDRHSRPHAPLSANGRLYIPATHRLYGLDAYNGTILWDKEMPDWQTRVNIPRDGGYMAADDDYLYLAVQNRCDKLSGQSGETQFSYEIPRPTRVPVSDLYVWGYLAYENDTLLGSAVRKGAYYTDAQGPWYDGNNPLTEWENGKVCSDYLFALGKSDGNALWKYDGLVINSTIAVGDGSIYFVENRNKTLAGKSYFMRRLGGDAFWKDLHLVALDVETGKKQWEKPFEFVPGKIVFYLSYADEKLVVVSSPLTKYTMYGFAAANGELLWQQESDYRKDRNTFNHGGHMQHPVIMEGKIYQDPHDFQLIDGQQGSLVIKRDGHGCGLLTGAPGFLMGRGDNPRLYNLSDAGKSLKLTSVNRPGCWINIISAGGMILVPEASSGCACEFPVQTSLALVADD
ncbi:MAG: PQQ-binding-like beta-propeller repeat protein [Sedimentisphaerales bacterium]|nr:PQQ-binding-like beta-propeller repeat protein [Sedimentisphaerales bacterium]